MEKIHIQILSFLTKQDIKLILDIFEASNIKVYICTSKRWIIYHLKSTTKRLIWPLNNIAKPWNWAIAVEGVGRGEVHKLERGTIATSCPWSETRGRVWLTKSMRSIYSLYSLWIYEYLHNFLLLGLENILIGDKLTWQMVVYIAYEDFHKLLISDN